MNPGSRIGRAIALAGAMAVLPGMACAVSGLDVYLASTVVAGQPIVLTLTVTNVGGVDATNITARVWADTAVTLSGPTLSSTSWQTLYAGQDVTFTWTGTAAVAGAVNFTATATADGPTPDTSAQATAGGTVVPAALAAQVAWSRTIATTAQGTLVMLTVTNTGGLPLANVIPQISVTGPAVATVPTPMTAATLVPGQAATFVWTLTGTAGGTIMYTVNASGDGPVFSPSRIGTIKVWPSALISRLTASKATVWSGQAVTLVLTVTNTGGIAATNASARAWATLAASGTGAATPVTNSSIAPGAKANFSWTVTPTVAGVITFTATATCDGSVVAPAATVSVTVYAATAMAARLGCDQPAGAGAPVVFRMSVTNTGTMTIVNLTAQLIADGTATVGAPSPASVAALVPKAQVTFVWTVVTPDARAMSFYAVASGFTASSTGQVAVASDRVGTVLAGIPMPGEKAAFIYPSPARDAANVAYTMAEGGIVTIRVYSEIGDLVDTVEEARPGGVWSSRLTTSGLAPGVYFFLLEKRYDSGTAVKAGMKKFVVVH